MEIIALQQYTDNKVSLYEGQIRNIEDNLANKLIGKGIVKEHTDDEGSSSTLKNIKDDPSQSGGVIAGKLITTSPYEKANQATGEYSFAEGVGTTASKYCSHSEGYNTTASETYSHAEGFSTTASGGNSHAEGGYTTASGLDSHAEGQSTTASGRETHAEGLQTIASGEYSHAQNYSTIASSECQTALGKFNIQDSNNTYACIIGNGEGVSERSNAFAIKWDGTFVFADGTEISPTQFAALKALLN